MNFECSMFEMFHWSLDAIDRTDIDSLLPFVFHYPGWKKKSRIREVFIDEMDLF